jgi:hypothetical protein
MTRALYKDFARRLWGPTTLKEGMRRLQKTYLPCSSTDMTSDQHLAPGKKTAALSSNTRHAPSHESSEDRVKSLDVFSGMYRLRQPALSMVHSRRPAKRKLDFYGLQRVTLPVQFSCQRECFGGADASPAIVWACVARFPTQPAEHSRAVYRLTVATTSEHATVSTSAVSSATLRRARHLPTSRLYVLLWRRCGATRRSVVHYGAAPHTYSNIAHGKAAC